MGNEGKKIAKVIVNLSLDRVFDYLVPATLRGVIRAGTQVVVPFGHSQRNGFVIGLKDASGYPEGKLKEIAGLRESHPEVSEPLIRLGEWMSEYYCCSREQAVRALLPGAVRSGRQKRRTLDLYYLNCPVEEAQRFVLEKSSKSPARCAILKVLLGHHGISKSVLLHEAGGGASALPWLLKSEMVEKVSEAFDRDPFRGVEVARTSPQPPTPEQACALGQIEQMIDRKTKQHTLLLHGVTGSGKTEVYLQAIKMILDRGRDAIVLVPEISLTPQTTERFRGRFGEMVSVLHSGLSDGERYDEWMRINNGRVRIVVGARSALFAPFKKLGLIIVDEEHENSYKQDEAPRYHARDVAVMRGLKENACVILGSATPSLESAHNAAKGKYLLSVLSCRVDDKLMPEMEVVDMRQEAIESGSVKVFSRLLVEEIHQRLVNGEQSIIFLNRRGYSTQLICQSCGYVARCVDCSIPYTFHKKRGCLSCHLCGAMRGAPESCPECGGKDIMYSGMGTERIESIAKKIFPSARICRMDSDTMTRRNSYEVALDDFRCGRTDILIGTQMIAKGLHFPNVTLVGIVFADLSLHMPDFRAHERTFQLLTQVAGRAGRGDVRGKVLIQTYTPYNVAIQFAVEHDYEGFFSQEMEIRKQLCYPPCGHLLIVHFHGANEGEVAKSAEHFAEGFSSFSMGRVKVSGPGPAPVEKIKGKFRYQMIFRGHPLKDLKIKLRELALNLKKTKDVRIHIDVDAVSMM
ncbi:MAG: primosomal protein N' [Victivallales bacterium]|nr:primosomal protein N' [Victivallales bacterium]